MRQVSSWNLCPAEFSKDFKSTLAFWCLWLWISSGTRWNWIPPHIWKLGGVSLKVTGRRRRRQAGQESWHSARHQTLTFHLKRGDLKERPGGWVGTLGVFTPSKAAGLAVWLSALRLMFQHVCIYKRAQLAAEGKQQQQQQQLQVYRDVKSIYWCECVCEELDKYRVTHRLFLQYSIQLENAELCRSNKVQIFLLSFSVCIL